MKYINIYLLAGLVLLGACSKEIKVTSPSFAVTPLNYRSTLNDTLVYNLTDTIRYAFKGYAGNVVMYNGTAGHCYDFRNRSVSLGTPILTLTSNMQNSTQTNTLQLLATNKLPGLDSTSIVGAQWTDITSRATLSTGTGAVGPDTVQLGDLVGNANDSLFLAFKYTGATGSAQPTWTLTNYNVINMVPPANGLPGINYNLSSLSSDANYWTKLKIIGSTAAWTSTTGNLSITGGSATAPDNVNWIVSKPLYLGRVSPDLPSQIVQNINSATQFGPFTPATPKPYMVAGTYKVTFVFFNDSVDDQKKNTTTYYIKVQ